MKGGRILVTGGGGYLGAWIARRLLGRGMEVVVLDVAGDRSVSERILRSAAQKVEWIRGDVSEVGAVMSAARGCTGIIHLAAMLTPGCRTDPVTGAMVNVVGTLNAFEATRQLGLKHLVYTSSAAVFGTPDADQPWPVDHYGAFKLANEGCARAYRADHGISSTALRPLVIYGPERTQGVTAGISQACAAAARGEAFTIPFSGPSGFAFVDDVAAAFEAATVTPMDGAMVYDFWGVTADVDDVVRLIGKAAPGSGITSDGPRLQVPPERDSSAVLKAFPGLKLTGLEDGLRKTIEYYAKQGGSYETS